MTSAAPYAPGFPDMRSKPTPSSESRGPITLDELRGFARHVAAEASFVDEADDSLISADITLQYAALKRMGLRITDSEELVRNAAKGLVDVVDGGRVLAPQEAFSTLGVLGEQAYSVAVVVMTLLEEAWISQDPDATAQEKEEARACRYDGFRVLDSDFSRALQDARGVAAVIHDIEQRRNDG